MKICWLFSLNASLNAHTFKEKLKFYLGHGVNVLKVLPLLFLKINGKDLIVHCVCNVNKFKSYLMILLSYFFVYLYYVCSCLTTFICECTKKQYCAAMSLMILSYFWTLCKIMLKQWTYLFRLKAWKAFCLNIVLLKSHLRNCYRLL